MDQQYYSDQQLAARYNVSRQTIWRWVRLNCFPTPVQLSPGCTRWHATALKEWEQSKEVAA